MQIQQLNRDNAEQIFGSFRNVTGSTISAGSAVELEVDAITDGNSVTAAKSGSLSSLFIGIADESMVDDAYGLVQVYGYRASAYVSAASAGTTVGSYLQAVSGYMTDIALASATSSGHTCVTLAETVAVSTVSNAKVFIRAL